SMEAQRGRCWRRLRLVHSVERALPHRAARGHHEGGTAHPPPKNGASTARRIRSTIRTVTSTDRPSTATVNPSGPTILHLTARQCSLGCPSQTSCILAA